MKALHILALCLSLAREPYACQDHALISSITEIKRRGEYRRAAEESRGVG